MPQPVKCSECAMEIPEGSPFGLCPCVLGRANLLCSEETLEASNGIWVGGDAVDGSASMIGPYQIIRKIGEGGFGSVYLAWQKRPVRREVAVKVLKPGIDSRQIIGRFEAERRTLARLEHANISTIYDAGQTDEGLPYFVMEYVNGVDIRTFCRDHGMAIDQRIALFKKVCQAIHHAHQKGIVHRDLKAANILVVEGDPEPYPKVIDFGIAKALSAAGPSRTMIATRKHQVLGTLAYMSPEQASGGRDIDIRTDIYSLGAVLYELLTGAPLFSSGQLRRRSFAEMLEFIRDEVPPLPSIRAAHREARNLFIPDSGNRSLEKLLRGDLDSIVSKAMEKDRDARYHTIRELVDDLERHERNEPVHATKAGRLYLAGKFVRRYRATVIAGGLVFFVLVMVITASTGMTWRASEARLREAAARHRAESAVQVREVVQQEMDAWLNHTFGELFGSLASSANVDLLHLFARRALAHYAAAEHRNDAAKQAELFANIGAVFVAKEDWKTAARAYAEAIRRRADASVLRSDVENQALAQWMLERARCLINTGAYQDAGHDLDRSAAALAGITPSNAELELRADLERARSMLYEKREQYEKAVPHLERALGLREESEASLQEMTETRNHLAVLLSKSDRSDSALDVLDEAINSVRELGNRALRKDAGLVLALVQCLELKAGLVRRTDVEGARLIYQDAVEFLSIESEPSPQWLTAEAALREDLSALEESQGRIEEAEGHQLGALNAYRALAETTKEPVWIRKQIRSHLWLGRLQAFRDEPFKYHWKTGLSLLDRLPRADEATMVQALRQELNQLKGQWLSGLR